MSKLGTEEKPAIVRVTTEDRANEILKLCNSKGWTVIIEISAKHEDISDVEKLLNPPKPAVSQKVDRNSLCPCGSEKKAKKCCY